MAEVERVTKIGYYKERVTVERVHDNRGTEEGLMLPKCRDIPRDEFKNAFVALIPIALGIIGIKDRAWLATAIVSQLTIGRDGKGRRNFVLTIIRPLEHGVAVINTPVRMEKFEDENGPQFATDEFTKVVDRVCAEATIYAEGQRQQLKLELDVPTPTPDAGSDVEEHERELVGAAD